MILKLDEEERLQALDRAIERAASGEVETALKVIKSSPDSSDAVAAMVVELACRVKEQLDELRSDESLYEPTLTGLVTELARGQDFEQALEIATSLRSMFYRIGAFSDLAVALAEAGRFEDAINAVTEIDSEYLRAYPLTRIVERMAWMGDPQKALDLAGQIAVESFRLLALERLAIAFLERGLVDHMRMAIELVHAEGAEMSLSACSDLAVAFARRGEFYQALKLTTSIDDDDLRAWPMEELELELLKRAVLKQLRGTDKRVTG